MASVTWHERDAGARVEEGKVSVLAKLLFVNGVKKRKLVDLQGPPERGTEGQVILRFGEQDWCGIKFARREQNDEFAKAVLGAMPTTKRGAPSGRDEVGRNGGIGDGDGSAGGLSHFEAAVKAAMARAQTQNFVDPNLPPAAPFGGGAMTERVWKLVKELCAAWEATDARRDEARRKTVEMLAAERDDNLRVRKQVESDYRILDAKLRESESIAAASERTRKFLEEEVEACKKLLADSQRASPERLRQLEDEILSLRQRLKECWEERPAPPQKRKPPPPPPLQDTACTIAAFEAGPLRQCPAEERPALRKRLLLKWHPDKQPSAEHANLAKRVMQELQNLPDWQA